MKCHNWFALIWISTIILLSLGINGCTQPISTKQVGNITSVPSAIQTTSTLIPVATKSTPTVNLTAEPISTKKLYDDFPPSPTQVPTQFPGLTIKMNKLLHADDCKLPCYLGIKPGITRLNEGKAILESIGIPFRSKNIRGNLSEEYDYFMRGGIPDRVNLDSVSNGDIIQYVALISQNDIVQSIEVAVSATELKGEFRAYWSRYSVIEILNQYGPPDQLYLEYNDPQMPFLGHTLILYYRRPRVIVMIYGDKEDNSICTETGSGAHFLSRTMILIDPDSEISLYSDRFTISKVPKGWISVEKAFGISKDTFYKRLMTNPTLCFKLTQGINW
jgi:hypothetical protein